MQFDAESQPKQLLKVSLHLTHLEFPVLVQVPFNLKTIIQLKIKYIIITSRTRIYTFIYISGLLIEIIISWTRLATWRICALHAITQKRITIITGVWISSCPFKFLFINLLNNNYKNRLDKGLCKYNSVEMIRLNNN